MAYFYIYETVEFPLKLSDKSALDNYDQIVISLQQGKTQLDIFDSEVDEDEGIITFRLDQEQTAMFKKGKATLQVNIYYKDQERDTSSQVTIEVLDNLYKKVIT